jgi:diguanylate cyclase (GGDEF)-like protein
MRHSLIQALGIIDCCILKRLGLVEFEVLHANKTWFHELLPEAHQNNPFVFSQNSAYLDDFLIDAEEFWRMGNAGQIHSGICSEQTASSLLRLEAIAAIAEGEKFLVITNLQQEYDRQQQTLQVARELLISNDKVMAQHDYVHERLDSLLKANQDQHILIAPIQKAIESASSGIVIADEKLQPINHNPAALALFDIDNSEVEQDPLGILLQLFENQFPEYDRVFAMESRWGGELFWHKPPNTSKWLQMAVYPVLDDYQSVKHWLFIVTDITRLKYLLQKNEKLTLYDGITNIPNRQFFWQNLEQQIAASKPLFVLYLDIKHFKRINEVHGHAAGDHVLIQLADRLKPLLGSANLLARVGGDEFAIICHNTADNSKCRLLAERLIEAVERSFYTETEQQCRVGLSIGIAHFPSDASHAEDLMKFADLAVYSAKKQSKSSIQFYSLKLKEASVKRLALENALREAIEHKQFELYLQPMLDLQSGKIVKAEALLRWYLPNGDIVSPDDFIPAAEQSGLIVPIGKWVISRACEMLAILNHHQHSIKLSINLSPRQITDRQLFSFIHQALDSHKVDPKQLELELTEGVLVDDYQRVEFLLNEVRNLGISVSIDDFGTGYSSLSYLKKLPIDYLKIDRSFVKDLATDENDKAIVLAVIAMAHRLKLGVIAEGVETQQQSDFLKLNHCDSAQGFLFSKPVRFEQFCEQLSRQSEQNS